MHVSLREFQPDVYGSDQHFILGPSLSLARKIDRWYTFQPHLYIVRVCEKSANATTPAQGTDAYIRVFVRLKHEYITFISENVLLRSLCCPVDVGAFRVVWHFLGISAAQICQSHLSRYKSFFIVNCTQIKPREQPIKEVSLVQ